MSLLKRIASATWEPPKWHANLGRTHLFTWWWKGWRDIYTSRDVRALARMIRVYLPDLRLVCITDQPDNAWHPCEMERFPLWPEPTGEEITGRPTCFRRLKLMHFPTLASMGVEVDDVVISMDLDSIVSGDFVKPIRDKLLVSSFTGMGGVAARIHGSLFAFRAGTHQEVWTEFDPEHSPAAMQRPLPDGNKPIGSDQAWMTRVIQGEHLWQEADGCYSWNRHGLIYSPGRTQNARYWSFAGTHKPWSSSLIQQVRPDLHRIYMDAYGRA